MGKKVVFSLLVCIAVGAVVLFAYPRSYWYLATYTDRTHQAAEDKILADSGVPAQWIRTAHDDDVRLIDGANVTTAALIRRMLTFTTTDPLPVIASAYRAYGREQEWTLQSEGPFPPYASALLFDTPRIGVVTVYLDANNEGTTVKIERLMVP